MSRTTAVALVLAAALSTVALAQQSNPQGDPKAMVLAAQARAALIGATQVGDATLTGNVTRIAGGDKETGTARLLAKGRGESRVELTFANGDRRVDIRASSKGHPSGAWQKNNGPSSHYAQHNCWTDSAWFFPPLMSFVGDETGVVLSFVGLEVREGASLYHLRSYRSIPDAAAANALSMMDVYLDASFLPVAVDYLLHSDKDMNVSIPVEIRFSDYESTNGVRVPRRVQQYLRGALALDFKLTSVSIDSGLPDSTFSVR